MSSKLSPLLEEMTPQERAEVEAFATFVLVRRHLQQPQLLTEDISTFLKTGLKRRSVLSTHKSA